jgi:glycine/D-amino acid oxidase-like deaminating enzyme
MLVGTVSASLWRAVEYLSGQGLFGDHPGKRLERRAVPRCDAILRSVKGLFPRAGNFERATFWTGLRPSTPSNIPYVGRTRYRNLWLDTGHGTLGWTLGAGFRLANMIGAQDGRVVA